MRPFRIAFGRRRGCVADELSPRAPRHFAPRRRPRPERAPAAPGRSRRCAPRTSSRAPRACSSRSSGRARASARRARARARTPRTRTRPRGPPPRRPRRGAIPEHLSDCAESEDAPGNPTPHHSWLAMLAAEDRAAAPFPPQGTLLDDPALYDPYALAMPSPRPAAMAPAASRAAVFSAPEGRTPSPARRGPLRRRRRGVVPPPPPPPPPPRARARRATPPRRRLLRPPSSAASPPPPRPPPRSLIDRLKSSVAEDPDAVPPGPPPRRTRSAAARAPRSPFDSALEEAPPRRRASTPTPSRCAAAAALGFGFARSGPGASSAAALRGDPRRSPPTRVLRVLLRVLRVVPPPRRCILPRAGTR